MLGNIKKQWPAQFAILLYIIFALWWIILQKGAAKADDAHQLFAAVYGVMALWGALWGLSISQKWGGLKSTLGRAISMFAFGLLFQEFGQVVYSYYIYFQHIQAPYPSLGDVGYFGSIFFYIYGTYLLGEVAGQKIGFRSVGRKILAIVIPLIMLSVSYYFFLRGTPISFSQPLTVFLTFGYPFGQAIYISLALTTYFLSRGFLGGIMHSKIIFFIAALAMQYASDSTFLYQSQQQTWYAGGINDFMYCTAYFLMTMAIFQMRSVFHKLTK